MDRGKSGQQEDSEIEGVADEEARRGVANGDEDKEKQRRYEEGEGDEELVKLAN